MAPTYKKENKSYLPGAWQHFSKLVSPPNQSHASELICQHKLMKNPIAGFKLAQYERQSCSETQFEESTTSLSQLPVGVVIERGSKVSTSSLDYPLWERILNSRAEIWVK